MLLSVGVLRDFVEAIAVIALLAVAYGAVHRALPKLLHAHIALGAMFGASAIFAMFDPLTLAPGVLVDMRSLPVALAGAYLGLPGMAVALTEAIVMRAWIGGVGVWSGVVGLALSALAGLAWAWAVRRRPQRSLRDLAWLGLAASASLPAFFLLPWPFAVTIFTQIAPFIVALNLIGMIVIGLILERERMLLTRENRLRLDSGTDALTLLLNRRGFEAAHGRVMAEAAPAQGSALLLIDLDHFKQINDLHGHTIGDFVLQSVARRLRHALRHDEFIGRLGGDEIAVLLPAVTRSQADEAAQRVCREIGDVLHALPGIEPLRVTASVGAYWSDEASDLATSLACADRAMYEAKGAGRDRAALRMS